jgi:tetratricopeptide (TPR) repeat protein
VTAAMILRRDFLFYTALFGVWALFLALRFGGHRYFGEPLSSAGFEGLAGGMSKVSLLRNSLSELHKNYIDEKIPDEKPHILQNIGCAYYDLYKEIGDRSLLDSALMFVYKSTIENPRIARFHYNFGRLFTELGDQKRALQQYEAALQYEPAHILALSNAGTCSYFAFGQGRKAAEYFGRALLIDSLMPMCHVVLGLISLDEKDYAAARLNFEKEIAADEASLIKCRYPLSAENIRYAASLSHQNLAMLYSTKFKKREKAIEHFDRYLAYEPDRQKKDLAAKEFRKYWGPPQSFSKTEAPGGTGRPR